MSRSNETPPPNESDQPVDNVGFTELWNAVFETYYDAFFNEMVADRVINRWQIVDDSTKILVAVTASGSAISGWALWNNPSYRWVWTVIAAFSAILGIVHTSLTVAHRLNGWGETKRSFASLRIELETLQYRMKFDLRPKEREFQREFIRLRRQYLKAAQSLRNDMLLRRGLEIRVQRELDRFLEQNKKGI